MRKFILAFVALVVGIVLYLALWPVPVEPVAWTAPSDAGYTGQFAANERLAGLEMVSIGDNHGPEALARDSAGRIYAATFDHIVRLAPDGSSPENWATTGGRPLGMAFDREGTLYVVDARRGLLSVAPDGRVSLLADRADGTLIRYADDLDVADDGKVYFSDASTRFPPGGIGTLEASVLEIVEHGGSGRLLVYDPATRQARTLLRGLTFANGVAVSHDQQSVLVNETGSYRVLRVWIAGPRAGQVEPLIENLPGFPDNIKRGAGGRYWLALYAPRNALLDRLAGRPALRKVILRLPRFIRPRPRQYGHIVAIDDSGRVVADLQDPAGRYPSNTGVLETDEWLYVGSLVAPTLARLPKSRAGL